VSRDAIPVDQPPPPRRPPNPPRRPPPQVAAARPQGLLASVASQVTRRMSTRSAAPAAGAGTAGAPHDHARHVAQSAPAPAGPWPVDPSVIDVESFVAEHYTPYDGDASFLAPPTRRTEAVRDKINALVVREQQTPGGLLDVDTRVPSDIDAFPPGYIDRENETIVGFQTDVPGKRSMKPRGGWRMVESALTAFGREMDPAVRDIFSKYAKTHNEGTFDGYTGDMRKARKSGILTGLPDAYGRGRIIGDYRRVALYGVDALIAAKEADKEALSGVMTEHVMRLRGEVSDQIKALGQLKAMAASYGFDISGPARHATEAVQWLYFGYLAAVKEQDGAAMSLGRVDGFLDAYIERDLASGALAGEAEAQELIDQLVLKLRMVKHLRPPEYNELFSGDPTWVTCSIGGAGARGHMVTKTSFRLLHTLSNLGPAPEPNMSVLWHRDLPDNFKRYCAKMSIDTCAIQYLNDMVMAPGFGNDYGIACCVSAMRIGKDMQFFGARCNLPKLLLYALNNGRDEVTGDQVADAFPDVVTDTSRPMDYDATLRALDSSMDWLAKLYVNTMNVIHFNHDRYNYERIQMALHDTSVRRFLAMGVAGLSTLADSLSAIKHAKVFPVKDERGLVTDFRIEGDFPKYGNDDDRVDDIAQDMVRRFHQKLSAQHAYRDSIPTLSVLTITSNVVYGKKTGNTPDGRKRGEPFAPGANPLHGRDDHGAVASCNSVAKVQYENALDGISYTFSIVPTALGKGPEARADVLTGLLDGFFEKQGHHINVNVLNRETLLEAMEHPEKYPHLTIRVSGYAVHFNKLTRAQQEEVIARTFHESL